MASLQKRGVAALTVAAIGVVYGDIGTSPLYTVKEVFSDATGVALNPENLIGAVSAIFWLLMLVVTLKYVVLILRADNRGEGGIMALVALAVSAAGKTPQRRAALLAVGVLGASLFYGDGVITPAISVLSAVEGLEVMTPRLEPYVLPIAIAILVGLFVVQRRGTADVGRFFGPTVIVWFITLAVTGVVQIVRAPQILQALNPVYAIEFLASRGWGIFAAVGAIVLAVTGSEALYADLGHFGKRPIRLAWNGLVLPSLALNYMGQGALLIADPRAIENPFYRLFPETLLLPAVVLASIATIIASQAVISGAYSMTQQAIHLGFLPRMTVSYTSAREMGQIYIPAVNWILLVAVLVVTTGFRSSTNLAGAYGIAVTLTMLATTFLTFFVVRNAWNFPLWLALPATGFFVVLDALLVTACSVKFFDGGWFPIVLGASIFTVMMTWKRGRELLLAHLRAGDPRLKDFVEQLQASDIRRVPGTAVFAVANPDTVPQALLHNLKHNKVLHERIVILNVVFHDVPWISFDKRVEVEPLARDVWKVHVNYGFMNQPDIPQALTLCKQFGLDINLFETSYFISRETVVPTPRGRMARWRERLFETLSRNAGSLVDSFRIPPNSVIELGTRIHM
ncbi:MAG: potassium transporter Kup [Gemmatimonadota bacterium]